MAKAITIHEAEAKLTEARNAYLCAPISRKEETRIALLDAMTVHAIVARELFLRPFAVGAV